jgi:hypothetical protein
VTYLDVGSIGHNLVLPPQCLVIGPVEGSETPLLGNDDLLPSGELVSCSSESLHDDGSVLVSASDGHDDLTTVMLARLTRRSEGNVYVKMGMRRWVERERERLTC